MALIVFWPTEDESILLLSTFLAIEFAMGYAVIITKAPTWLTWLIPAVAVVAIHNILYTETPGFRMLALIFVLLTGMKTVVVAGKDKMSIGQWFFFCFCWIGMNPSIMRSICSKADFNFLKRGILFISCGVFILYLLKWRYSEVGIPYGIEYWVASLLLLVALSQILHFGLLNLNSFLVQAAGFKGYALFRSPLYSGSLQEFWGRRWNLPFIEMNAQALFRPLSKWKLPAGMLVLITFMFSGILHEVALSLPVNTGHGLPLLYFMIHGVVTAFEPRLFKQKKPGPIWVIGWLLIPLPLLFHSAVMKKVFWAIIG